MNKSEQRYHDILRRIGCVICRELGNGIVPPEIHHIAQGSEQRDHHMCAGLCVSHHRVGETSIHGGGVKRFLRLFRLSSEYDLLGLVNKFRSQDGI